MIGSWLGEAVGAGVGSNDQWTPVAIALLGRVSPGLWMIWILFTLGIGALVVVTLEAGALRDVRCKAQETAAAAARAGIDAIDSPLEAMAAAERCLALRRFAGVVAVTDDQVTVEVSVSLRGRALALVHPHTITITVTAWRDQTGP